MECVSKSHHGDRCLTFDDDLATELPILGLLGLTLGLTLRAV